MPTMIVNAQHMKNVPGRKTDVKDAEWIAKLLSQGLLRASFIPDREQREFRELTRFRKSQMEERARNLNRLQKMLEGANIKFSGVVRDINGKSAQSLLELVVVSESFDISDVQQRMENNIKASAQELHRALEGTISPIQRKLLTHLMNIIREQTIQIAETEVLIKEYMGCAYRKAVEAICAMPGIGTISAEQIIAEIGVDMSRFPTAPHLCRWAGICPGNNESAGKRKNSKTNYANKALKSTLVQCAQSAKKKKDSFFKARYERLVVRRGKRRATVAVAHSMLTVIWHVLQGTAFQDLGYEYYTRFNREKKIYSYTKQLAKLGLEIPDNLLQQAISA